MVKNIIYYPTYHHNHYDNMKYIIHNHKSCTAYETDVYSEKKWFFQIKKIIFLCLKSSARQKLL